MSWNYKGINIELRGSSFAATVGDRNLALTSLNAVKKAIEKHLDAKAQEVVLNLPVVIRIIQPARWGDEVKERDRVIKGVITGVDLESKSATGLEIPDGWRKCEILPDTPKNTERLESLIDAEAAKRAAEKEIEGRSVDTSFAGYGRNKRTYSEAVELLKQSYEKAKKAQGDE